MYVTPVKTEYDREDLFLSRQQMEAKRICEYILNQSPQIRNKNGRAVLHSVLEKGVLPSAVTIGHLSDSSGIFALDEKNTKRGVPFYARL